MKKIWKFWTVLNSFMLTALSRRSIIKATPRREITSSCFVELFISLVARNLSWPDFFMITWSYYQKGDNLVLEFLISKVILLTSAFVQVNGWKNSTIKVTISREIAWTTKLTVVDILAENTRLIAHFHQELFKEVYLVKRK